MKLPRTLLILLCVVSLGAQTTGDGTMPSAMDALYYRMTLAAEISQRYAKQFPEVSEFMEGRAAGFEEASRMLKHELAKFGWVERMPDNYIPPRTGPIPPIVPPSVTPGHDGPIYPSGVQFVRL